MFSPFAPAGLNLHYDAEIDALADRLASTGEEQPCALLISGQSGEGRRYLVARAVERMRASGVKVLHATVDLDGYEPDRPDPLSYARHAAAKRGVSLDPADEGWIRRSVQGPRPTLLDFFAAALLAGCDASNDSLRARLTEAFAATDPWTALAEGLGPGEIAVIHLADTAELPSVLRERLLELSSDFPQFKTVISCLPDDGLGKLVRGRPCLRFEVMPLDFGELRTLLEDRLGDPGLPESFYQEIWADTAGVRGLAAASIEKRIESGALLQDGSGRWTLADASEPIHVGPGPILEEAGADLDPDDAKRLASFVSLAALCGDNVPVRELLEYLGVESRDLDSWIDRLDETVGADSEHALFADRFQHPSLPGRTIYGFASGAVALRIRKGFSDEGMARLSGELMRFLAQRFTVSCRAAARFYVEISRWAQAGEQRLELERELAWWVGTDELEAMRVILTSELAAGHRSSLNVWTTANTVQFGWPPERTLALLHAIRVEDLPPQLTAAHAVMRAGLFLEAQRPTEAIEAAETGLATDPQDRLLKSALWERIGRAYLALGRQEEAREPFGRCGRLQEQMLEDGDARVAPWIQAYVRRLREAGNEQEATRLEGKLALLPKS